MRKYYTRACNFYYGNYAKKLLSKKNAYPLAGNSSIVFDQIEIFQRKKKGKILSNTYSISEFENFDKKIKKLINQDLKKIISQLKNICGLKFDNPEIMVVLNITPDSFSDGGLFYDEKKANNQIKQMLESGASIIDIGGESTRPGSKTITESNEWSRINGVISEFKKKFPKAILSLDTRKSEVMNKGIKHGIDIINDVSGFNFDKKSFHVVKSKKIPLILHHMQGTPNTMQKNPIYDDVLSDIFDFFESKIKFFTKVGYKKKLIILYPGIGF